MTTTTAPAPKRHAFRGDLEGIRGVALLVILATHLVEWPTGGQVALDVFFVLSGFLITGLLIREHAKTGTIDLLAFFRRRVRRLAPSATLVLVATLVASFLVFPMGRFITVAWDALWASLLVANWGFAIGGTDYFATDLPQSPLLHYWSLAVEEQFYLAWPFLVLGALALGARGLRRGTPARRRFLVAVLVVAFAGSFAWSLWQSTAEPQIAYLSTLTRVWELAIGALLACSVPLWQRIPGWLRPVLAWAGMLTILVAALIVTPATPYPGVAALIPVLSTAAVVVSGVGGENHLLIATNPVARYLGKISYTVYLWHWPIFVIMAAIFGKESLWYLVASVPLSFVLAIATFHLVEDPVRRSSWLEPDPRRRRGLGVPSVSRRRNLIIASLATIVVGVLVAGVGVGVNAMRQQAAQAGSLTQGTEQVVTDVADDADQVSAMIQEGLALESWPTDVTPSIDAVTAGTIMTDFTGDPCLYVLDATTMDECIAGDTSSERTAVLLGDSTSYAWVPGLDRALTEMGFRLVVLTAGLCPFADVRIDGTAAGAADPDWSQECQDHRAWAIQQAQDLGAELVIATDSDAEPAVMAEPVALTDLRATWSEALQRSVDAVSAGGAHVVILPPAPGAENLAECYTNLSSPSDCTVPIRAEWQQMYLASLDVADGTEGVTVVDSIDWFCADGFCPAIAGPHIVRMDSQHITAEYAAVLSGLLEQHLRDALGEPSAEDRG